MKTLTQNTRATRTIIWCANQLVIGDTAVNDNTSNDVDNTVVISKEVIVDVSWQIAHTFRWFHPPTILEVCHIIGNEFQWHKLVQCYWVSSTFQHCGENLVDLTSTQDPWPLHWKKVTSLQSIINWTESRCIMGTVIW